MNLKTLACSQVNVNDELPVMNVPITTTMVIAGALASRDFTPVHHDKRVAQAQGIPDVFMNILTTNGLVGKYVTDWAGPNAVIKKVSIKLGGPNVPGDTMKVTGKVVEKDAATGLVSIAVTGNNSWGNHVTGTVCVALPKEA